MKKFRLNKGKKFFSRFDPLGSYTGNSADTEPEQDADDL